MSQTYRPTQSMQQQKPEVLVVGAGPSGLLHAIALLKNGVPVRIIEKEENNNVGDRGAGVMPRTIEIEHFLGIDKDVLEQGINWPMMQIYDQEDPHRVAKSFPIAEHYDPTPAFPIMKGVMIGQGRHTAILRRHLETAGGSVEFQTSLVGLQQDEEGVTAEILRTVDDQELVEKARFSYVVGADGSRSTVRKSLGINFVGESRENVTMLLDAQVEGVPEEGSFMHFWGNPKKAIVSARNTCDLGMFHVLVGGPEVDLDVLRKGHGDAEVATKVFQQISGRTDIRVTKIVVQSEWKPNIRMADRFRSGRVFIIGDAAHAHPPTGGQGLNTSVQDAFNLAWKLALVSKDLAPSSLLDTYEAERMPVIAQLLNISTKLFDNIADAVSANTPAQAAVAAKQAQKLSEGESQWGKRRKLFQLDVNYRWSDAVTDERHPRDAADAGAGKAYGEEGHDARAGDRAPDAPGLRGVQGETTRLFDVFKPSLHTVLVFTPSLSSNELTELLAPLKGLAATTYKLVLVLPKGEAAAGEGCAELPDAGIFEDAEGHAFEGYGVSPSSKGPVAVIVRPDSWIGAFATSRAGVEAYVRAVFGSS